MKKTVLFDFSRVDFSDALVCDEHNLIHHSRMINFQTIANEQLKMAKDEFGLWCENKGETKKNHNTISIFANRGAGKTTFLLSALEWLKNEHEDDVLCLKPIDPSMIGVKENAFINIIAEIHRHVIEKIEIYDYNGRNGEEMHENERQINKCFTRLMEGLSFMEGIGKNGKYEEWDDVEYAAHKGIEKASSSNRIDYYFQKYIYYTLKLLGKKCVVISFDDIDTNFEKGNEILEIIRRFLTSPMIITILTGDLELYGKLVRKISWKCFDTDFLEKETKYAKRKEQEFSTMIDQLETHYLLKILKPEFRIHISSLKEYLENGELEIKVRFKEGDEDYDIGKCYEKLLMEIGGFRQDSKLSDTLKQFLLGQSLRTQIRLLSEIKNLGLMNNDNCNKESLAEDIQSVFWNDINQKTDNAKSLIKSSPVYTAEMLSFLDFTNSLSKGCSFLPLTDDDILNNALFAIGSKYNQLACNYHHLIFDYWCRISYTETFNDRLPFQKFSMFLDYSQLKTDSGLIKSMGLMHAFCYSMPGVADNPVIGIDELSKLPVLHADAFNFLITLPSYGTIDRNNNEHAYFSIYKLMALISNTMRFCQGLNSNSEKITKILAHLSKNGQYRAFSIPDSKAPHHSGEEQLKYEDSKEDHFLFDITISQDSLNIINWVQDFINWGDNKKNKIEVSCHSLHHIFVRFYYTMAHITHNITIADKFNKYVLSLLNAAIIEAAIDNGLSGFDMGNLGDIEYVFMKNVRRMKYLITKEKTEDSFKFYNWLASCPLLLIYIDPEVRTFMRIPGKESIFMDALIDNHLLKKNIKYCEDKEKYLDAKNKDFKIKIEKVNKLMDYNNNQTDIEVNNSIISRYADIKTMKKLKEYNTKKQKEIEKLRKNPIVLTHGDYSVSYGSDSKILDEISVNLFLEKNINDRNRELNDERMKSLKEKCEKLKQEVGFKDDWEEFENEVNNTMLSVYETLEKEYPLYRNENG